MIEIKKTEIQPLKKNGGMDAMKPDGGMDALKPDGGIIDGA